MDAMPRRVVPQRAYTAFVSWKQGTKAVFFTLHGPVIGPVGKKYEKRIPEERKELSTMLLTGAQIFVEVLVEQGVDTIFGYPGGSVLNL